MAAEINSVRRFYLLKSRSAAELDDDMSLVWRAKQEAEPGDDLPGDFPNLTRLQECLYSTVPDLYGADATELTDLGFTASEAAAILTALEALL